MILNHFFCYLAGVDSMWIEREKQLIKKIELNPNQKSFKDDLSLHYAHIIKNSENRGLKHCLSTIVIAVIISHLVKYFNGQEISLLMALITLISTYSVIKGLDYYLFYDKYCKKVQKLQRMKEDQLP
jgi:hypothetical protein